jgi:pimeloyl-ACP methyl ester carboxylesterase
LGYPVVASSWRGTGGTSAGLGVTKVKIDDHVADLESLLDRLDAVVGNSNDSSNIGNSEKVRPVILCHSFRGLAVMKCLEKYPEQSGQALLQCAQSRLVAMAS